MDFIADNQQMFAFVQEREKTIGRCSLVGRKDDPLPEGGIVSGVVSEASGPTLARVTRPCVEYDRAGDKCLDLIGPLLVEQFGRDEDQRWTAARRPATDGLEGCPGLPSTRRKGDDAVVVGLPP